MKHPCEIRWTRLCAAVNTMERATAEVQAVLPGDQKRQGRLSALSDVKAVMAHIEAEEGRHG